MNKLYSFKDYFVVVKHLTMIKTLTVPSGLDFSILPHHQPGLLVKYNTAAKAIRGGGGGAVHPPPLPLS